MSDYDRFNPRIWLRKWLLKPSHAELKAIQARPFISLQMFQEIALHQQLSDSTYGDRSTSRQNLSNPEIEVKALKPLEKSADPMPSATLLEPGANV